MTRARLAMRAAGGLASVLALASASGCGVGPADLSAEIDRSTRIEVRRIEAVRPMVMTEVVRGDTLESISRRLAGDDWVRWRDALGAELDARHLALGTLFHGTRSAGGRLEELIVVLDRRRQVVLRLDGERIHRERLEAPLVSTRRRLEGTIKSSLFEAVEEAGGSPDLAIRVAEIFQWDVDFLRDLRFGDRFVVLVDEQEVEGELFGFGELSAARFVNHGRTLTAVAYPDDHGRIGYYDLEGRPLRKQFLRSPLKLSRVTSRFSMRRNHPVLHRPLPHFGVDYGAPVGTAVHATADGTVESVGRNGGAGNMVTVRHPNGYETCYLHLSRYGQGVRRGARVSQGQVIGYVGSSGLSTGPHLDYRVKLKGRWIDPLRISSPLAEPLGKDRLADFLSHAADAVAEVEGRQAPADPRIAQSHRAPEAASPDRS